MPLFKSVLVEEEKDLGNGRVRPGVTAFVPMNDAAKAHSICDKAIQLGVYKPKDGETPKEMGEKLLKKTRESAIKERKL